jgi:hypothetical protein
VRLALLLPALLLTVLARPGDGPTEGRWRGQALGVCWEGSPRPIEATALDSLVELGVNAISQTPFAFMRDPRRPELSFPPFGQASDHGRGGWWGERDAGIAFVTAAARERGIGVLLKPHVWLHGSWPGEVEMASEEDWATWFASYRSFLLGWARFAAEQGIEGLCLGTELDRTALREREWRALIADVRTVYSGLLTYAANWDRYESVPFWDALDAIGVNAYFPLTEQPRPSLDVLAAAWEPHADRLAALSRRVNRPVVFTEIGYHPAAGVFARPWEWHADGAPLDPDCQARGYEAVHRAFLDQDWFGGVFWWKWHAGTPRVRPGRESSTFSPQGLAAEEALLRAFGGRRDAR